MKKTVFGACVLALGLMLSGCESANNIDGRLRVLKPLTIVDSNKELKQLTPGDSMDASLKMTDKGSELSISTGIFSNLKVVIKNLVKDQMGDFRSSAAESDQRFDSEGNISISQYQFDASGYESCLLRYDERVVCVSDVEKAEAGAASAADHRERGDRHDHHPHCHVERVAVYGHQWVNETDEATDKNVAMKLVDASTREVLANFSGSYRLRTRVIFREVRDSCH